MSLSIEDERITITTYKDEKYVFDKHDKTVIPKDDNNYKIKCKKHEILTLKTIDRFIDLIPIDAKLSIYRYLSDSNKRKILDELITEGEELDLLVLLGDEYIDMLIIECIIDNIEKDIVTKNIDIIKSKYTKSGYNLGLYLLLNNKFDHFEKMGIDINFVDKYGRDYVMLMYIYNRKIKEIIPKLIEMRHEAGYPDHKDKYGRDYNYYNNFYKP